MFTIRINWADDEMPNRTVYQASKYQVHHRQQSNGTDYITLYLEDAAGEHKDREVALGAQATAYVMNDQGVTVDVIRVPSVV